MKPTIGRKVWFYGTEKFRKTELLVQASQDQAFDATVIYVAEQEPLINVVAFDHVGVPFAARNVPLYHPDQVPADAKVGNYCTWMPYQVGKV